MNTPYTVTVHMDLDDAKMHVKGWVNATQGWGWILTSTEETAFVFTRTIRLNGFAAFILLLLGIIPGLLYIFFSGPRKQTRNIYFKVLNKNETRITLEAVGDTAVSGRSLTRYLCQFDPKLEAPPLPPSAGPKVFQSYFLCLVLGMVAVVFVALVVLAMLPA